ncbi:SDR family NAD(P)-dependent oxidoreductase [Virgibacillus halophilus]|uniref:SDR family NAD(P)-dependent oxidoreductase n=1 Tax=Tigheibacillus halophilus TaxID=361280 RepID=A0ABU5C8Y1_9BACI|nr:SDR family NAD(P)-dependent oxidoreductase [Virgibacillus halophilus]
MLGKKTATVTGASSGIGTAIAKQLVAAGANVVLGYKNVMCSSRHDEAKRCQFFGKAHDTSFWKCRYLC